MAVNAALDAMLDKKGAAMDAYYHCPHHPDYGEKLSCECRKPAPGMALRAAAEMELDLTRSYFIGDKASDVLFGKAAGGKSVLVLTGYGADSRDILTAKGISPDMVADTLLEAADWIAEDSRRY